MHNSNETRTHSLSTQDLLEHHNIAKCHRSSPEEEQEDEEEQEKGGEGSP